MARRSSLSGQRGRSTPSASEPADEPGPAAPAWRGLTAAPRDILDVPATRTALEAAVRAAPDRAARRGAAVAVLRQAHAEARAAIATAIAAAPREAHRAIHDYAWLVDRIVTLTLDLAAEWLHPLPNPTSSERCPSSSGSGSTTPLPAGFHELSFLVGPSVGADRHPWRLALRSGGPSHLPGCSPD